MVNKILLSLVLNIILNFILFSNQNLKINISTNRNQVRANESFQINVEVTGAASDIKIKDLEGLDSSISIQRSGTMSNFSIINGVMSSSMTYTYFCAISKEGEFDIGPFEAEVGNDTFKSDVLKVKVSGVTTKSNYNSNNYNEDDSNNKEDNSKLTDSYILSAKANKTEVFVNEYFDVVNNFYAGAEFKVKNYKAIEFPPFTWVEKLESQNNFKGNAKLNNRVYYLYELEKKRVYISKPGTYTIQPVSLELYGYNTNSFFAVPEYLKIQSEPINIIVKPLPESKPAGFNDIVGIFKISSSISSKNIKTKEPTTLTIVLEGEGNFQNINDIGYKIDDSVEVYSSKSNVDTQNLTYKIKKWEVLLVPSKPGKFDLRVNDFCYFDINQKKYVTLKGSVFNIEIIKGNNENSNEDNTYITADNDKRKLEEYNSIKYIKLQTGFKNTITKPTIWFYTIIFIYIIIILVLIGFIFIRYSAFIRIKNSSQIREKKAFKVFINDVGNIKNNIKSQPIKNIIDELSNKLEKYFIWKFNIGSVEFTAKGIQEKLGNYLTLDNIEVLKNYITQLDMIRFGGTDISHGEIIKLINDLVSYIKGIESKVV